ncbi:MAG: hypothetical protein ACRCYY_09810 [Trueperaceae bacterium]
MWSPLDLEFTPLAFSLGSGQPRGVATTGNTVNGIYAELNGYVPIFIKTSLAWLFGGWFNSGDYLCLTGFLATPAARATPR